MTYHGKWRSSSESNLPQTIPPSKQHKLGTSATGIWLGGSLDNNNIYVQYVDESAKGNRQCRDGGTYCSHIQKSHLCLSNVLLLVSSCKLMESSQNRVKPSQHLAWWLQAAQVIAEPVKIINNSNFILGLIFVCHVNWLCLWSHWLPFCGSEVLFTCDSVQIKNHDTATATPLLQTVCQSQNIIYYHFNLPDHFKLVWPWLNLKTRCQQVKPFWDQTRPLMWLWLPLTLGGANLLWVQVMASQLEPK